MPITVDYCRDALLFGHSTERLLYSYRKRSFNLGCSSAASVGLLLYSLLHCFSCNPGRLVVGRLCTPYVQIGSAPGTKGPTVLPTYCYSFNTLFLFHDDLRLPAARTHVHTHPRTDGRTPMFYYKDVKSVGLPSVPVGRSAVSTSRSVCCQYQSVGLLSVPVA